MVFFNYSTMQMAAKVVYYGPGLCGKTTNLQWIFEHTSNDSRGEMVSLATETDRTLFFDLLPIDVGSIAGFSTRIQLYTVPGQVFYNTTRKLVLKGVDGVVFVADSQKPMLQANIESFQNLEENLAEMGLSLDTIPLVLQYNKRDLPNIMSTDEMSQALNPDGRWQWQEASALNGDGVFETLKTISKATLLALKKRLTKGRSEPAGGGKRSAAAPAPTPAKAAATPPARPAAPAPPKKVPAPPEAPSSFNGLPESEEVTGPVATRREPPKAPSPPVAPQPAAPEPATPAAPEPIAVEMDAPVAAEPATAEPAAPQPVAAEPAAPQPAAPEPATPQPTTTKADDSAEAPIFTSPDLGPPLELELEPVPVSEAEPAPVELEPASAEPEPARAATEPSAPAAEPKAAPTPEVDVAAVASSATTGSKKKAKSSKSGFGIDALAELEKLRKQTLKSKAKGGTEATNGRQEIRKSLQLSLPPGDLSRAKRFALTVQLEDADHRLLDQAKEFHVELDTDGSLEQVLLNLKIALSSS